jgi:ubiquinone/menaquinone biosynthesis C-methylase UbiE
MAHHRVDGYTHGHHDSVLASHRARTVRDSAAYLVPHLASGQRLLDVGCGPGTITADLAELVAPGEVVALDREPAVLEEASRTVAARNQDNVTITAGDVYALDFADGAFDVVHAHQLLQHLSDPVAALREMRRVTRSGGLVAARDADYEVMTWFPPEPRLGRWLATYRALARSNGAEPDAGRRLLAWAHQAGFSEVRPSASAWVFADESSRSWWAETWAQRTTSSSLAEQAIELGIVSADELADMAAGWQAWADHADGWFSVLHGEIIATA